MEGSCEKVSLVSADQEPSVVVTACVYVSLVNLCVASMCVCGSQTHTELDMSLCTWIYCHGLQSTKTCVCFPKQSAGV